MFSVSFLPRFSATTFDFNVDADPCTCPVTADCSLSDTTMLSVKRKSSTSDHCPKRARSDLSEAMEPGSAFLLLFASALVSPGGRERERERERER